MSGGGFFGRVLDVIGFRVVFGAERGRGGTGEGKGCEERGVMGWKGRESGSYALSVVAAPAVFLAGEQACITVLALSVPGT